MAINRADILRRAYQFPEFEEPSSVRGAGRGTSKEPPTSEYFGIPKVQEGLQYTGDVANLSNLYFQKLTAADQFAKEMWHNRGIDVTRPDWSDPEAVDAANFFKMQIANAASLGDELKVSQKMLEQMTPNVYSGEVTPSPNLSQQPFARFAPQDVGQFTGLAKPYQEMVDQFSGARQSQSIISSEQNQLDSRLNQELQRAAQLEATDPVQANFIREQVHRTRQAANMYLQEPTGYGGLGTSVISMAQDANVLGGGHETFTPVRRIKNGYQVYESTSNDFIGIPIGNDRVSRVERAAGKTYLVTEKGKEIEIDRENAYKYMYLAAKTKGLDKEFEGYIGELLKAGKVKKDKAGIGYVFNVPIEDMMTPTGVSRQKELETTSLDRNTVALKTEELISGNIDEIVSRSKESPIKRGFTQAPEFNYKTKYPGLYVQMRHDGEGNIVLRVQDAGGSSIKFKDEIPDQTGKIYVKKFRDKKEAEAELRNLGVYDEYIFGALPITEDQTSNKIDW